jgi:hypothetical protein
MQKRRIDCLRSEEERDKKSLCVYIRGVHPICALTEKGNIQK